jgi:hypothetical protein
MAGRIPLWETIVFRTLPFLNKLNMKSVYGGIRRLDYLKKHLRALYTNVRAIGKLPEHLHEINKVVFERSELIIS